MTQCELGGWDQRFGGTYCLRLQCWRIQRSTAPTKNVTPVHPCRRQSLSGMNCPCSYQLIFLLFIAFLTT